MQNSNRLTKLSQTTIITYLFIILTWIVAWTLKINVLKNFVWIENQTGSFLYWTTTKVLLWLLPAFWLLRVSKRNIYDLYSVTTIKKSLLWGFGIGVAILIVDLYVNFVTHNQMFKTTGFALINVLLVAPLFEEYLMRGAIMGNLQKQFSPWVANVLTSFMFLGLHIPGWYFTGSLGIGLSLSVFFASIVFGFVAQQGKSVLASTIAHFFNNLANI